MNLWQRKLLAYLHDPPGKPFNIVEHREMAETLIRNAGLLASSTRVSRQELGETFPRKKA